MTEKSVTSFSLLILLALTFLAPSLPINGEEHETTETLTLSVFFDGYTFVDHTVQIDPTDPTVNVTLVDDLFEDILVVDDSGLPLDYSQTITGIIVYSLGAEKIQITYSTQNLTSKIGRYWTLQVYLPINTTIILPEEASIVGLNIVPDTIESFGTQIRLLLPPGQIELTYVIHHLSPPSPFNYGFLAIVLASLAGLGALIYGLLKRRPRPSWGKPKEPQIDLQKLSRVHHDLRHEEKQAIQILTENHGKAFEAEIYEKLQLPRTTTWRMIKRLEKMQIITITKFRQQNLVSINSKYYIKKRSKKTKLRFKR